MTDLFRGIVTFICAVFAYFFVYWLPMALLLPTGFGWALVGTGVGFAGGFFGPMLLAPNANQGPLLGLFITGPLGFVFGAAGGALYWFARGRAGGTS